MNNAIHPFREGNGRAQRAFCGQSARQAGFVIHWEWLEAERNAASIAIMQGDPEPMRRMLDKLVGEA